MARSHFMLRRKSPETGYVIQVDTPAPAAAEAAALVVVLDADDQFDAACAAARALSVPGLPPLLLAGVGYGGGYRSPKNRRVRDYTPSRPADEPMESGGAAGFSDFLAETMVPALAALHPLRGEDACLVGHSLGALFGVHALCTGRAPFRRFLVSAPSLWWDDRAILREVACAARSADRPPTRAFFGVGQDDTPSMLGDLELLEGQLRSAPLAGLEWTSRRFPDHNHHDVLPTSFSAGLRWLYAG